MPTILELANSNSNLSLFSKGLVQSGLENKLSEHGPFTILGPVNLALGKLDSLSYQELLNPVNEAKLVDFLASYILVGKKMVSDFRNNQQLATLQGKQVTVTITNGDIMINGSKILSRDRQGSNGVVHLLDTTYSIN